MSSMRLRLISHLLKRNTSWSHMSLCQVVRHMVLTTILTLTFKTDSAGEWNLMGASVGCEAGFWFQTKIKTVSPSTLAGLVKNHATSWVKTPFYWKQRSNSGFSWSVPDFTAKRWILMLKLHQKRSIHIRWSILSPFYIIHWLHSSSRGFAPPFVNPLGHLPYLSA